MSERVHVDLRGVTDPGDQAERVFHALFPDPAQPFAGWETEVQEHDLRTCSCSTCETLREETLRQERVHRYLVRALAEQPTTESEAESE